MQMVKKIFLVFVSIWIAFLMFMPKAEFYYALEAKLAEKDILINEGSIEEGLFTLTLNDVSLYVKGIEVAKIKEVQFFTLLFYSSVTIDTLDVDASLQGKIPEKTSEASATHTLFLPTILSIDANGTFGMVEGNVNLLDNNIRLNFVTTDKMDMLKSFLKKDEKGWYYERSF